MANYYYVRDGAVVGNATGNGGRVATTPRSSTWSATTTDSYVSIEAAIAATTPPVAGDFIYCASDHNHNYGMTKVLNVPTGVTVISTDILNQDRYKKGASEECTGSTSYDLSLSNSVDIYNLFLGMSFSSADQFSVVSTSASNCRTTMIDCSIASGGGTNDLINQRGDGTIITMINSTITLGAVSSSNMYAGNGGGWKLYGCTIVNATSILQGAASGGAIFYAENCDFSGGTAADPLFKMGDLSTDDRVDIKLVRCNLPATTTNLLPVLNCRNTDLTLDSCSNWVGTDDPDAYYYSYYECWMGAVDTDTGTYLTATYDGTHGVALEFATSANASIGDPLRHKIASIPVQDLTSSATYEVEFTCANTLTDGDCWIELARPEAGASAAASDLALGIIQSGRGSDYLAGSAHTTSVASWTAGLTNTYKQSLTVNTNVAQQLDNAVVEVWFVVAKASETIVVDPAITIT